MVLKVIVIVIKYYLEKLRRRNTDKNKKTITISKV